jgi:Nif-specific regulatory protein
MPGARGHVPTNEDVPGFFSGNTNCPIISNHLYPIAIRDKLSAIRNKREDIFQKFGKIGISTYFLSPFGVLELMPDNTDGKCVSRIASYTTLCHSPLLAMEAAVHNDEERLARNQHSLLEAMPEMVLLIDTSGVIEFMNPSAIEFFGDLRVDPQDERVRSIQSKLFELVTAYNQQPETAKVADLNNASLEYNIAPFSGYKGENLFWLIIRDFTEIKRHKDELNRFHQNVESILTYKINELKESERIRTNLSKQLENLKNHMVHHPSRGTMVGSSNALREIRDMVFQVAKSDATVLVTGESGTGKELIANLIHQTSNRKDKPFLTINCNAINESLLESDLFGHEKGAFTGAHIKKKGKFEAVDGGTIFLDEIGDISPRMQAALLRVLQQGEIIRVGGNTPIKIDVRIIAATNMNLAHAVYEGSFRLDLFYRLNIINIAIPPLRERREDIADLVHHFVDHYSSLFHKKIDLLPKSTIGKLEQHDWPGNVRELENVVQRAILMCKSGVITSDSLFFDNTMHHDQQPTLAGLIEKFNGNPLKDMISEVEKEIIRLKLEKYEGNVARVADTLKIGKTALYDKMKRYGVSAKSLR